MALENWQQRVVEEKAELDEKIKKLDVFCNSEKFWNLDGENRTLLRAQYGSMCNYSAILGNRIELF